MPQSDHRARPDGTAGKIVHVILNNYAAHKHEKVRARLDRHPRWTFHFTPTSSSWLNVVEGFFAILTRRRSQNGAFRAVVDLPAAINRFIDEHNRTPKPFTCVLTPTPSSPHATVGSKRWGQSTLMSAVSSSRRDDPLLAVSSCSVWPPLDRAGSTIMRRRLIML